MTNTPEITPETLQNISFEIIAKLLTMWRDPKKAGLTFKSPREQADWRFSQGIKLHTMVIEAMRLHPDLEQLRKLHGMDEEVLKVYELAKRIGIIPTDPRRTETGPQPQKG
jgi:hypothetical protein